MACLCLACSKPSDNQVSSATTDTASVNSITEAERAEGWELLFDGKSLDGWKRYGSDTIGPLWSVKEGAIVCDGEGLGEGSGKHGGSLMTEREFGNFELTLEWKIAPGGNSGILYHVVEDTAYNYDYETGPEYQVLDDKGWKGEDLKDSQLAGSSYDMFAASKSKNLKPAGEWNTARIIYNSGYVEHWLNGEKVVSFDETSEEFMNRYKESKWVNHPGWNKYKVGAISLQDHGAPVYYRNIKIRML